MCKNRRKKKKTPERFSTSLISPTQIHPEGMVYTGVIADGIETKWYPRMISIRRTQTALTLHFCLLYGLSSTPMGREQETRMARDEKGLSALFLSGEVGTRGCSAMLSLWVALRPRCRVDLVSEDHGCHGDAPWAPFATQGLPTQKSKDWSKGFYREKPMRYYNILSFFFTQL